ncbi:putative CdaR family transcriptional regulator [Rhodococcus sp. AW25M09]|uniref:PucR family transcriptional regulator n=1 Tax=Rhodococcus sp. AW25M09 TaxID=1268303 RepID=UPI0002AC807B|nr:PucR family transcriptional regulator [Rhodococcus sp. AW25M09]CCQ15672.1 putative CdaR family transcriptional regulator [Rhodococcus sp. AW25M09]
MDDMVGPPRPLTRDLPASASYALTVSELLALPSLAGSSLVAGERGLEKIVRRVNVIEVPDILPWVKQNELLLTTGFPLRHADSGRPFGAGALVELVEGLAERGAAALGVKEGRYFGDVPAAMIEAADRLDLPLFLIRRDVGFDEVIAEVFTHLVDRQAWALDIADRMHRALTSIVLEGGDLPQIADEVATLFEASVLICTPDGRVQATAGADADLAALEEMPLFDPSGRLLTERLHEGLQPVPGDDTHRIAVAPIIAGGTDHGLIVAVAEAQRLGPVTMQSLERAATVVALAVIKKLAVSAVESKFRGDFLRDVLNGATESPEQIIEYCAQLDWDVNRRMVVIVARLDEIAEAAVSNSVKPAVSGRLPQERLTAAWQQVVRRRDRRAPVVGFSNEVVTLMPAEPGTEHEVVDDLIASVAGDKGGGRNSFGAGVSRVIDSVADIPRAYDQARKAVMVGRRMSGNGSVAHFDSLGVHRLLSLVTDAAELQAFASEVLGSLAGDDADALDLRQTLQALLDTNCNVAETARVLHFHYNTLRYRIGKLESIVGPFTTDPILRLDVALALRVAEMKGL